MGKGKKTSSNEFPWKELLTLLGVVIAAYFSYQGIRSQVEIPIKATQTAEANFATASSTFTDMSQETFTLTPAPIPPATIILNHFKSFGYESTWINNDGTIGVTKITDVEIDENNVTLKYEYGNGVLKGVLVDNTLSGTWQQDNSNGSFELAFTPGFSSASGWWNDAKDVELKYEFGLIPPTTPETPFTGGWQGIDPYDGSITSISLVQTGNELVGTYNDSLTVNVEPPGYHGKGIGTVLSTTTGQIIFNLYRWDGMTAIYELHLTFSNQNNTLVIDNCRWNNEVDALGCPMILQKK